MGQRDPRSVHKAGWLLLSGLMILGVLTAGARVQAEEAGGGAREVHLQLAGPQEKPVVPLRGLTYTAADIREMRRIARKKPALREKARKYLRNAEKWLNYKPGFFKKMMPSPDAKFAYGRAGDPKTNQRWSYFGNNGICSLDRPGQVRSPYTDDVYGNRKPGQKYYDPGDGWVRDDGKRFYFKGVWNAYVDRTFHDALDQMSMAYLFSGDPRVARRAMLIFDLLATLRAHRPKGNGVADWPWSPPPGYGFFSYMGNLANERMVNSAHDLDLFGRSDAASDPSANGHKLSRLENIEKNYFQVLEREAAERHTTLQNHALMALTDMIAQGELFGKPDMLRTGIAGTYAFLDSNLHRDGSYYEVSGMYSKLGRAYGGQMISLLTHYDPANYDNAAAMPRPSAYPYDLRFGRDPRWYGQTVDMNVGTTIMGRRPQYGDMHVDRRILKGAQMAPSTAKDLARYLRLMYYQTDREDWRRRISRIYWSIPAEDRGLGSYSQKYGLSQWMEPPKPDDAPTAALSNRPSALMAAKGMALLRSGSGDERRALFMRGGAYASHAHDDQMATVLYGAGMMLAGEFGYRTYGSAGHQGWGTRTISHQSVVVNEDLPVPGRYKGFAPPADIDAFVDHPPVQLVEMSNPALWSRAAKEMKDYRRTAWLIDLGPKHFYELDMFRVVGGQTHDYAYNAPYLDPPKPDNGFHIEGVSPKARDGVWTLASLSGKHRDADWNQRGQSWGERLLPSSGTIKGVNKQRWNPPPGDGYGFIYRVKAARTDSDWSATWDLIDGEHRKRLMMVNFDGMTVATGLEPCMKLGSREVAVFGRRTAKRNGGNGPLSSRFCGVIQIAAGDDWSVSSASRAKFQAKDPREVIAARMKLADGGKDVAVVSPESQTVTGEGWELRGRRGFIRRGEDGRMQVMMLNEGTRLRSGRWSIRADSPARTSRIRVVHTGEDANSVTLMGTWPAGKALAGSTLLFDSSPNAATPYIHNEYYKVERIDAGESGRSRLMFDNQSLRSARVRVEKVNASDHSVKMLWPTELIGTDKSGYLTGKGVTRSGGYSPRTYVRDFVSKKKIRLADVRGIKPGMSLDILATKPGDVAKVPTDVLLRRIGEARYQLKTNQDVTLGLPWADGDQVLLASGKAAPQALDVTVEDGEARVRIPLDRLDNGAGVIQIKHTSGQ